MGFLYEKPYKKNYVKDPLVSLLIPAWNEEVGIQKTVKSIMRNGYKNIEVIIINDGSKDNTFQKVRELKRRFWKNKYKIQIINQENTGKALALNVGISRAKGEIIITIDADSYITPGTIKRLVSPLKDSKYDVTIGQILVGNTKSLIGLIQSFEYSFGFHNKKAQSLLESIYIFPGALSAFRKSLLEEVNLYENYSCTEDLDLSMKIISSGHNVLYVEDAICITEGPSNLKGLFNQRVRWRHGFLQCLLHHKSFIYNISKGIYLSFIEFPLSILGLIEVLLFPIFIVYIIFNIINIQNPFSFISFFLFVSYAYTLVKYKKIPQNANSYLLIIFLPIFFMFINFLEFCALVESLSRILQGKTTSWTVWNRKGV